jgi:endonuclease YncB( thermonuclease family)
MRSSTFSSITSTVRTALIPVIFTFVFLMDVQTLSADSATSFEVLSGDMIRVGKTTYCLKGIDAPEIGQICKHGNRRDYDCGHIAKTVLMDLTAGSNVKCSSGMKQKSCIIGSCEAGGFDLSQNMVHTGWALSTEPRFARIQTQAKAKKHDLWKGNFDTPWIWRELQKQR